MITLPACASHLLVDLPLFGGPIVMVVLAVVLMARSERRRAQSTTGRRARSF
jgi:cytochrome c-type biogenesis protein CcmH/NrfF